MIHKEVILKDFSYTQIIGKKEKIGGRYYRSGSLQTVPDYIGSVVGTRVSFDVVPKDGSPKIRISKTFKSNLTYKTVNHAPPGPGPGDTPIDLF